jgi:hypothetical protein
MARTDIVPSVMLTTPAGAGRLSEGVRRGVTAAGRRVRNYARRSSWWREILLIGALYGLYELGRGITDIDVSSAFANGREILHAEQVWHLAPERVLNQALDRAEILAVVASYFYSLMHYLVTPTVLVWMYRKHRGAYPGARTALAISTVLGLIVYVLLPTAPPRMLTNSGLQDTLADTQNWGWWGGEGSVPRGWGALANQFAAMPSMHVGWSLWCGALIAIYARRSWVKLLGIAYPLATTIVVMATGNHYLLDAIAGAIIMGAGALLAAALPRRTPKLRLPSPVDDPLEALRAGRPVRTSAAVPAAARLRCSPDRETPALRGNDPRLCRARR